MKLFKAAIFLCFVLSPCKHFSQSPCTGFERKDYVWDTDYADGDLYLIRGSKLDAEYNDIHKLIVAWNTAYPITIELTGTEDGTAVIKIVEDNGFARSFGGTGASRVLASLVYTLTEDKRYENIRLDFEEGDHASPGVYTREDFLDRFRVCY